MSSYTSYIIFWMVIFVLLGAFWYIVDRMHGVRWYRRWYRLTHSDPLPANIVVGFIYNRRSRHKVVMATVLSTVQTFIALTSVETLNLLVELVLWIVEIPMVMLGFAIGPLAFKLWKRKDEMLDAVDDFEQSHFGESEDAKVSSAKKTATASDDVVKESPKQSEVKNDETDKPDPKKFFDRYTNR
ncbi:MAG: hypothetical protein ACSHYA_03630 [Opitutaceae bacterium]